MLQDQRTRVARVITRLNIGGPAIQAATLSAAMQRRGFDTLLIHGRADRDEGDIRSVLETGAFEEVQISSLRRAVAPAGDARALWAIYRLFRRFQPRIVHTHMAKAGALGRLAAAAYNRTSNTGAAARIVHTYHGHVFAGYFGSNYSRAIVAAERRLARFSDVLIAISPRIRDEIVVTYAIGRPEQVRVIPLGLDLARFQSLTDADRDAARIDLGLAPEQPVVTTVGRLVPIKQHWLFLDMAARLKLSHPDSVFLVVGDGPLRSELQQRAARLGLESAVRFLGWRADLPAIYAATDVFALTSANEGTPVALIEAMASGLASVSTDVGGVPDVIATPSCGVRIPDRQPAEMAQAITGLLADARKRAELGHAGRAHVLSHYSLERLLANLDALYREIL